MSHNPFERQDNKEHQETVEFMNFLGQEIRNPKDLSFVENFCANILEDKFELFEGDEHFQDNAIKYGEFMNLYKKVCV